MACGSGWLGEAMCGRGMWRRRRASLALMALCVVLVLQSCCHQILSLNGMGQSLGCGWMEGQRWG